MCFRCTGGIRPGLGPASPKARPREQVRVGTPAHGISCRIVSLVDVGTIAPEHPTSGLSAVVDVGAIVTKHPTPCLFTFPSFGRSSVGSYHLCFSLLTMTQITSQTPLSFAPLLPPGELGHRDSNRPAKAHVAHT